MEEVQHSVPCPEDTESPEYRPLDDERVEKMKQLYERMLVAIEELVAECADLPSREEVVEACESKTEAGEKQWKWSEQEQQEARQWIASPVARSRFLRARQWDVDAAFEMAKGCVGWRRTFLGQGVYHLDAADIQNEIATGKAFFHKHDKYSRPITVVLARVHDANARNLEEVMMFCVWSMENLPKLYKDNVTRTCTLFDLGGFSLKNMDYSFMKFMIHMLQNYYPETLGQCLIVNSPWFFSGCWAILKRWIDPASQKKVMFVDSNGLLEYIDKADVLECYGGTDPWIYDPANPLDLPAESEGKEAGKKKRKRRGSKKKKSGAAGAQDTVDAEQ